MDERRKLWIAIGLLAGVLVAAATCCCGTGIWGISTQPEYEVDMETARRDGVRDGPSGADACVRAAYERIRPCAVVSDCRNLGRTYLLSCLGSAPEPGPELCMGAPAQTGFLTDLAFTQRLCARYGWGEGSDCDDIASAVELHCVSSRNAARTPSAPIPSAPIPSAPVE